MIQAPLSDFGNILLFILGGIVFVLVALTAARFIRPSRPNEEKLTPYECGEDPVGSPWTNFNARFYIVALIFVLFEVEILFLFPWSVVFGNAALIKETNGLWGWFALAEVVVFVLILALGLAYAWAKGYLDWVQPNPSPEVFVSKVPKGMYEEINTRYANKRSNEKKLVEEVNSSID